MADNYISENDSLDEEEEEDSSEEPDSYDSDDESLASQSQAHDDIGEGQSMSGIGF